MSDTRNTSSHCKSHESNTDKITFNSFESAGITETVEKRNEIRNCEENPFKAL